MNELYNVYYIMSSYYYIVSNIKSSYQRKVAVVYNYILYIIISYILSYNVIIFLHSTIYSSIR